jgi:hypothetical protein
MKELKVECVKMACDILNLAHLHGTSKDIILKMINEGFAFLENSKQNSKENDDKSVYNIGS